MRLRGRVFHDSGAHALCGVLPQRSQWRATLHWDALHNYSERCPLVYDITVPYGYGNCYKNLNNINLHYLKPENINIGLIVINSPFGLKIKTFDIERTICDIIKDKKNMDIEIFTNALKMYAENPQKDLNKLMRYAVKLKIEQKVRNYMEVLL